MTDFRHEFLNDMRSRFTSLRGTAERAMAQVGDADFARPLDRENNSIALTVKHIAGNLRSRLTDFLTADGEKPDRNRDGEFELYEGDTRQSLMQAWSEAWDLLNGTVAGLAAEDVERTVYIRGEAHTVAQALTRHLSHLAYHVGEIVILAKHWAGDEWKTLTIPRGGSVAFNPGKSGAGR